MHFQNLECHFPPGFLAEGRRGRTQKLENSNMGINMGIDMAYNNQYMEIYIYIYIPYKFPYKFPIDPLKGCLLIP